ncbi:MAG: thiamine-phosphate kinase [Alphaproteobacteria bacterium]
MTEFDMIARYFVPLTQGRAETEDLKNDAAIFDIPDGFQTVVTSDTLNAGVHFLPDQPPATIAQKALRTNLSDLAAMGATPYCYQLCLSLPDLSELPEEWLQDFCSGLAEDQKRYNIFLSGGDTTRVSQGGMVSVSITAIGLVEAGKALRRSTAKAGDLIVLTGCVGDAYCGLRMRQNTLQPSIERCIALYHVPDPPIAPVRDLVKFATACIDVSDGVIADLRHMAQASNLQAEINLRSIHFSSDVEKLLAQNLVSFEDVLTGGDDYQLLMAVPSNKYGALRIYMEETYNLTVQAIGAFAARETSLAGEPVRVLDRNGAPLQFTKTGWQHF